MIQTELPMARVTDPLSSHEAASHLERIGAARAQREQALSAVKLHPGMTSKELACETGLDRHMLARRLPEIEKMNWVYATGRRPNVGPLRWFEVRS